MNSRSAQSSSGVKPAIAPARLAEQLRALGVREGGVLLVHLSYRAIRPWKAGRPA